MLHRLGLSFVENNIRYASLQDLFQRIFEAKANFAVRAPGRVNLIGTSNIITNISKENT